MIYLHEFFPMSNFLWYPTRVLPHTIDVLYIHKQSSLSVNSILYVCRLTESQTELHEYVSNDLKCAIRWVKNDTLEFKTLLYIQQKGNTVGAMILDIWHMFRKAI